MNRQKQSMQIIKDLIEFYKEPTVKLIKFLRKEKYSMTKIAKVLGVDRTALNNVYLKKSAGEK